MLSRRFLVLTGLLLFVLVALAGCGGNKNTVAEVDGQTIARTQLDKRIEQLKAMYTAQGVNLDVPEHKDFLDQMEKDALEQLIEEQIIVREAEKQGIKVADAEINAQFDQMKNLFPTEEEFNKILEQQKLTPDELKERFKFNLLADNLYKKITDDIKVTSEEIKDYFDKNREDIVLMQVRHILVSVSADASEDQVDAAKKKAQDIVSRLNKGEKFAELAKEFSEDPGTKDQGGLLPSYFTRNDPGLDQDFTAGAFPLKKGAYTKSPVRSSFGWHVILMEEKKETLEELASSTEARLLGEKKNKAFADYVEELTKKAKIERNLTQTDSK